MPQVTTLEAILLVILCILLGYHLNRILASFVLPARLRRFAAQRHEPASAPPAYEPLGTPGPSGLNSLPPLISCDYCGEPDHRAADCLLRAVDQGFAQAAQLSVNPDNCPLPPACLARNHRHCRWCRAPKEFPRECNHCPAHHEKSCPARLRRRNRK